VNYKIEKEKTVSELNEAQLKLSETKVYIADINRRKSGMRKEGRPLTVINKELGKVIAQREALKREIVRLTEKVRYLKTQIEDSRPLSDCFMDVCRRDLDEKTFGYLIDEARKLVDGGSTSERSG
jgi:predicted  nucleic acid-binding Zn-ribbon protein